MNKTAKLLSFILLGLTFLIICKTFRDYGVTWDEQYHRTYGELIIRWYQSFFRDTAVLHHPSFFLYGGFFDTLAQWASLLSPWGYFETRHLLGALFGLWAIFMSFKIAQYVSGYLAGFFTILFLVLHPVFYGHMFNNPADIPFAALLLTTLYAILSTYDNLPRLPSKDLFKIGLPLGLMLAVRIGGLFIVLPYLMGYWLLWLGNQGTLHLRRATYSMKQILGYLIRNFIGIFMVAWPAMLVGWPWAQLNPVLNPLQAALKAVHWDVNRGTTVFFEGHYFKTFVLPKSYMFKLILATLPEFLFIALFLGGMLSILSVIKKTWAAKQLQVGFLIFCFTFPVLTASLLTVQFDGYRHLLFSIPLLAILGGISFASFLHSKIARWIKIFLSLAIAFSLCLTVMDMRYLHPYETVYFNRIPAGGLAKAAKRYETDYWGNSYREGILWVIKNYHPGFNRKIRVMNASHPSQISYYLEQTPALRERFEVVRTDPDIYLSTTKGGLHKAMPGKILYQIERDNTPLLYVIEVLKKPA